MTNEADPTQPESSTDDLGSPGGDAPEGVGQGNSVSLTQEQAKAAGIMDPQPGDQYHITLTVGDTSQGISGTIVDGSAQKLDTSANDDMDAQGAGEEEDDAGDDEVGKSEGDVPTDQLAVKPAKKGQMIMGPKEMGLDPQAM